MSYKHFAFSHDCLELVNIQQIKSTNMCGVNMVDVCVSVKTKERERGRERERGGEREGVTILNGLHIFL